MPTPSTLLILDDEVEELGRQVRAAWAALDAEPLPRMLLADDPAALPADAGRADVLLAPPDLAAAALTRLPAVRWTQSTWAGVTPLLPLLRDRPELRLTAAKGLFGPRMAEYVFGWLASIERRLPDYRAQQSQQRWQPLEERDLAGRTLLLIGTGSIGAHLAKVAAVYGMRVLGLSRSGAAVPGIEQVGTVAQLHALLAQADHVVTSLPETPEARHLLDAAMTPFWSMWAVVR